MVHAEKELALIPEEVFVHGDIDREFIAAAIDPTRQIVIEGNLEPSLPGHAREHAQVIAVVGSPETVPVMVAAAVPLGRIRQLSVRGEFDMSKVRVSGFPPAVQFGNTLPGS